MQPAINKSSPKSVVFSEMSTTQNDDRKTPNTKKWKIVAIAVVMVTFIVMGGIVAAVYLTGHSINENRNFRKRPEIKYEWTRELKKYGIEVYEWAVAGEDYILMYSEDESLDLTPISKSRNFHDYATNLVALNLIDNRIGKVCFISVIIKDYETTIKELGERNEHPAVYTEPTRKFITDTRALTHKELFALSPRLSAFCSGSTAVRVRPESNIKNTCLPKSGKNAEVTGNDQKTVALSVKNKADEMRTIDITENAVLH